VNFVCGDSKVCEMAHFNGAGDLYDDSTGTVPFSVLKRHPSAYRAFVPYRTDSAHVAYDVKHLYFTHII
jgi:hypothetical protein